MKHGRYRIIEGDVMDVLPTLKTESVHCVVTSPPYWGLRRYLPEGHPSKELELGSEPTPDCGLRDLVVLRDDLTEAEHQEVVLALTALGGSL